MRALGFGILPLALAAGACHASFGDDGPGIAGTGQGGVRDFAVSGFTGVSGVGPDAIDVRVGSGFSVRAEGSPAVLDRLRIVREGDTLVIGRRNGVSFNAAAAHVTVTLPRLTGANLAGSGDMTIDRVEGQGFTAASAGSGDLRIAALAVRDADLSIAGSGAIDARGSATHLKVSIAGSGGLTGPALTATRADVSVAGTGSVQATVNGPASVSIVGSGDVDLGGGAHCSVSKLGSGDVRCGG